MMTQRTTNPKMYYNFSLDEKVPKDHLLRKINEVVDFSFIYPMVKDCYSHTGAPSVDPVVVFKLSLIGYLYNVVSERRLLEEASLNLAYLWFIGYEIDEALPDHSIMTKARIRFGVDIYREFFHRIVQACAKAGLIDGDTVFIDSTLIDSAASYKGGSAARSRMLVEELNNAADEFVEQVFEQNTQLPSEEKDSNDPGPGTNLKTNEILTSPTDRQADINIQTKEEVDDGFSGCKVKLSLADSAKDKEVNEGQNADKKETDKPKIDMKTNEMLASPTSYCRLFFIRN
ncbi:MAG: transposase [Actinobacteria bacterium]|nr:transposase [Actinomycetota bacterium]